MWVAAPSLWTIAQRTMVRHATLGVSGTRIAIGAWILAPFVDARLVTGALRIAAAFHGRDGFLVAVDKRITDHIVGATADRAMILGHALGVTGTWIAKSARIFAHSIAANFGCETVLVGFTSLVTSCKDITISSSWGSKFNIMKVIGT